MERSAAPEEGLTSLFHCFLWHEVGQSGLLHFTLPLSQPAPDPHKSDTDEKQLEVKTFNTCLRVQQLGPGKQKSEGEMEKRLWTQEKSYR